MSKYITVTEFLSSPYGSELDPSSGSIFSSTGAIDEFLTYISALVDTYCGRSFEVQTYTHEFNWEESVVMLPVFPVITVTNITYETSGGSSGFLNYYTFNKNGKIKLAGTPQPDWKCIVTYDAGYTVVPDAIKQATMMLAHTYAQSIDSGSVGIADGGSLVSFRFGKFMEQYSDPRQHNTTYDEGIPITVEAILRKFRYLK